MSADTDVSAPASLNGSAPMPGPESGECVDCVTNGERIMAALAVIVAIGLMAMAVDMLTGGKVSGFVREQVSE